MVKMGRVNTAWTYINIDDAWQGQRGGPFNAIQPNEKFPDFKGMVDYIHSLGLKAGIYSTPMITSYAGYVGGSSNFEKGELYRLHHSKQTRFSLRRKNRFETNDARQMAAWGIDYLKYDSRTEVESAARMLLPFNNPGATFLSQYLQFCPFASTAQDLDAFVQFTWRTGPDIRDSWYSLHSSSAFTLDKMGARRRPRPLETTPT